MNLWSDGWATSGVSPRRLSKYVTDPDRYDLRDYERLMEEVAALAAADDALCATVDTGGPMIADTLWALLKAEPQLAPADDIQPKFLPNWLVAREALDLDVYRELHEFTMGDDVAAAHACLTIEPDLETLFDRLRALANKAKEMQRRMTEYRKALTALDRLGDDADPADIAEAEERALELGRALQQLADELADDMEAAAPGCRADMRLALGRAASDMQEFHEAARLWGCDRTELLRMPADERLALARRLDNDRLRRLADLIGKLRRLTLSEQSRVSTRGRDAIVEVTIGRDLRHVLPSEIAKLRNPATRKDFVLRYAEGRLLQYRLEGAERVARGGIEYLEDGSGSMKMPLDKEYWARAVGLNLLDLAHKQGREFRATYFGSSGHTTEYDFTKPGDATLEHILKFAEASYGLGEGTDFETPLRVALKHLQEEHDRTGAVSADVVFCTDGECGVSAGFMKRFKKAQAELGFRVFGVWIGEDDDEDWFMQQFREICDAGVWTIGDLHSGDDIRGILRSL